MNLEMSNVECGIAKTTADIVKIIQDDLMKRRAISIGTICASNVSKIGEIVIERINNLRGFMSGN